MKGKKKKKSKRLLKIQLFVALILMISGAVVYTYGYLQESKIPEIELEKAYDLWLDEDVIFIDVRPFEEYDEGHLSLARNFPINNESAFISYIVELDKDENYVVYCNKGVSSLKASEIMKRYNFPNAYSLIGGFNAWKEAGYFYIGIEP